jgi:hypothetical protein
MRTARGNPLILLYLLMPKKRQPYNPAAKPKPKGKHGLKGHLGVPNPQRDARSRAGFDVEAIADGRYVSRERAMLTPPALIQERHNELVRKYEASGEPLPERIQDNRTTPSDRATAAYRNILWAYLRVRADVVRGNIKIGDYEGAPSQRDPHRLPLSKGQFDARRWYAWLRAQHGMLPTTEYLDKVACQINPEMAEDCQDAPTKADLGRDLIDLENTRDLKSAADGALVLACRTIADAARDFVIIERRRRDEIERNSRQLRKIT